MMNELELVQKATKYAAREHGRIEQLRKYTFDPYIVHPWAVYQALKSLGAPLETQIAGLLHDVPEDCGVHLDHIEVVFGKVVRDLVDWCTDRFTHQAYPTWNRAKRKQAEADRLAGITAEAVVIKLVDFLDNYPSHLKYDPIYAALARKEKLLALPHYQKAMEGQSEVYRGVLLSVEQILLEGRK